MLGATISIAGIGLVANGDGTWPLLGAIMIPLGILFIGAELYGLPDHVLAWRRGVEGEAATARALAPLEADGYVVLHDRRIPGRRENIDHLVIGPTGVVVIESKRWHGRVEVRGDELFVGGRRRTEVIAQVGRQVAAVRAILGSGEDVPKVRAILCVHEAELPLGLLRRPTWIRQAADHQRAGGPGLRRRRSLCLG